MSGLQIFLNPNIDEVSEILDELNTRLTKEDESKIIIPNSRVEFIERENYLFVIFYLPEYRRSTKTIEVVELDLLYDIQKNNADIFATNTEYFFEKYQDNLEDIKFNSFGKFLQKFLAIILEDESKIIDHILEDTNNIRKEYSNNDDTYKVIRHLTTNLINISALNLIVSNQHKLIESANDYFSKNQLETLNYKRNYILEELIYAKDFCDTLMSSINTKFQVKSSDDLYVFTKYSFIIFVAELIIASLTFFKEEKQENFAYFGLATFVTFVCTAFVLFFFRRKK